LEHRQASRPIHIGTHLLDAIPPLLSSTGRVPSGWRARG
jgi:hypothetical protein